MAQIYLLHIVFLAEPEPEVPDDDTVLQRFESEEPPSQADFQLHDSPGTISPDYDSGDHLAVDLPEAALAKVAETWRRLFVFFVEIYYLLAFILPCKLMMLLTAMMALMVLTGLVCSMATDEW